jgi:hypothetical protein
MADFARDLESPVTTEDLWAWWSTLNGDQQDLLRITASSVPIAPSVVDFLAQSRCPALADVQHHGSARIADAARLTAFVAHA